MVATDTAVEDKPPKSGGKLGVIIGLVLALATGAGGFYASYSGLLNGSTASDSGTDEQETQKTVTKVADSTFIPLDPLIVTIRSSSKYRLLRFTAQLEVYPEFASEIDALKPRIVDVMNTFLNALEASSFEDPIAMIKLRAQLLRRIQIVTDKDRVKDLLIMEFVLQ